jgi:hypothetical protein
LSKPSELIPNSFQVPNLLVDRLLPHLSGPQAKVLMVLCRKTFGWNKREDVISFGQFRDIAGVSRSSAVDALRVLVNSGLVTKAARGTLEMSSWSLNLNADPESVLERLMPGTKTPADGDKGVVRSPAYTDGRPIPPVGLDRPEVQTYTAQRPTPIPPVGLTETQLNPKPKSISSNVAPSPVEEVWDYYREKLKRSLHLELTKQRRSMGEAGLKACEKMARINNSANPAEDAIALMKVAIDRLAESPWHNGENATGAKYLDWEVLFRGRNAPSPQKLTDYWLDDDKFPEHGRGAA